MVRVQHRADICQPFPQPSIDVVFPERPARLDCARSEREDERTVGVWQRAEVQSALQHDRLEAEWQLHGGSLQGNQTIGTTAIRGSGRSDERLVRD